jgi:hypothetical protein
MPILVADPNQETDEGLPVIPEDFVPAYSAVVPKVTLSGNGDSIALTVDGAYALLDGVEGLDMPPVAVSSTAPGLLDGSLLDHVRYRSRELFLPVGMFGSTSVDARALKHRLSLLLDPKAGDVRIDVAQSDGTNRHILARYVGGMDGLVSGRQGVSYQSVGLAFTALDPSWLGPTVSRTVVAAGSDVFLSDPFIPVTVTASQVLGDLIISNNGDSSTEVVTSITGPGTGITISNGEKFWGLDTLAALETITLDGRRGIQTVTDQLGVSSWSRLDAGSQLWGLDRGENPVGVVITGATEGSGITISHTERFLTAW